MITVLCNITADLGVGGLYNNNILGIVQKSIILWINKQLSKLDKVSLFLF